MDFDFSSFNEVVVTPAASAAPAVDDAPRIMDCRACPLRGEARRVVPSQGPVDARVMVVGQNPGDDEDMKGQPFVGRAGRELDEWLRMLGLERSRIAVTHAVHCHTRKNRTPTKKEVDGCSTLWLPKELDAYPNVKVIIPLGKAATEVFLRKATPKEGDLPVFLKVRYDGGREFHVIPLPNPGHMFLRPTLAPVLKDHVFPVVKAGLNGILQVAG